MPDSEPVAASGLLRGDAFQALFEGVTQSAERLETRDHYEDDRVRLNAWLCGDDDQILAEVGARAVWLERIRRQVATGVRWRRVRVVSQPPTTYQRYALRSCQQNVDAGEDIQYLERGRAIAANLPAHDFWLFDGSRLAVMYFRLDDRFVGAHLVVDVALVTQHRAWLEEALRLGTPYPDFLAADPTRAARPET